MLLAVLSLVWGTNWPLFPIATREVSVWTFRSFSLVASGSLLLLIARLRGESLVIERRYWSPILAATLFYLVIWNLCSTYAARMIPSGQAAILGFTMPLWSALISWALLRERLDARLLLALSLGACGVALLMWDGLNAYAQAPLGFALGLLAAIGWAIGTLILKRAGVPTSPLVLTGWQLLVASVPLSVGAVALGDWQWFMPSWTTILVILWVTLVPMCIGNWAWFSIVGLLPTTVAGLSSILVPVVGMVSGALINGEPLGPLQLAAMACCCIALGLALYRPAPT